MSNNRQRRRAIGVEVRVVFEPSRVAKTCMAEAYERVVPTVYRSTRVNAVLRPVSVVGAPARTGYDESDTGSDLCAGV